MSWPQHCLFLCDKTSPYIDRAPCPVIKPYHDPNPPWQYDGNLSLNSDSYDSHNLTPDASLLVPSDFSPQLHSTPTQENLPNANPQTSSSSVVNIPGMLDSLNSTPSSASLQSWSDLDSFLPFTVTTDINHEPPNVIPGSLDLQVDLTLPPDPNHQSPQPIPVLIGVNPPSHSQPVRQPRSPYRRVIRRDNRVVTALSLPNIMVTNHRSIFPKFNNLVDEILENDMHLGLHSEIWEDKEKVAHANTIEEALEILGIQYISSPRPNRRGGGAAITLITDSPFTLTQLDRPSMSGDQSLET